MLPLRLGVPYDPDVVRLLKDGVKDVGNVILNTSDSLIVSGIVILTLNPTFEFTNIWLSTGSMDRDKNCLGFNPVT